MTTCFLICRFYFKILLGNPKEFCHLILSYLHILLEIMFVKCIFYENDMQKNVRINCKIVWRNVFVNNLVIPQWWEASVLRIGPGYLPKEILFGTPFGSYRMAIISC